MKVVSIFVFVFATSVAGAPTIITSIPKHLQEENRQILRDKRSKYGLGYYSYGAASSPIAAYSPYQMNIPVQNYLNPYAYGYQTLYPGCGRGYYRSQAYHNDQEMMSFSDKEHEHQPASRNVMDTAETTSINQITPLSPSSMPSIGQLMTPTNGPAYGMFSNVQNVGCNVPLLFSCSPSIVPLRMRSSPQMGYGYGPYGYRGVEDMSYEPHGSFHEELAAHDSVGAGVSAVEANHEGGHQ
ncbi:uncharacterized protein LOC119834846 [Zerene cesonia]|uniref:uncharacterized protein LOC119834846 n=1 Tax=Zerene cesonia TaxID=33412 RepID=UPI0018E559C6|nr:uncharacterized protein LOC119834846 [Zerene cesonia]